MAHQHDYWEDWRGYIVPQLGVLAKWANHTFGTNLYATATTTDNQFVGLVDMDEEVFEKVLHTMGFERNPLAAWKSLTTGETEEGSFRWIPPKGSEGPRDMQLHVILFDGSKNPNADHDKIYVYAHWEYRWDVHPWKHYRGVNYSVKKGVAKMRGKLRNHGTEYDALVDQKI